jgi:hypothetical protein
MLIDMAVPIGDTPLLAAPAPGGLRGLATRVGDAAARASLHVTARPMAMRIRRTFAEHDRELGRALLAQAPGGIVAAIDEQYGPGPGVGWAYSGTRAFRDDQRFIATVSVARHVTGDFPPTFLTVGNADPSRRRRPRWPMPWAPPGSKSRRCSIPPTTSRRSATSTSSTSDRTTASPRSSGLPVSSNGARRTGPSTSRRRACDAD